MQPHREAEANEADATNEQNMKILLSLAILSALSLTASAVEYSVFRVCEDQHVIRTSDGAEAGRVEYIVVEPSSHRVISTVITGGVIGERLVALPIDSLQFSERQITLTQIDRTRLVSAPVIEKTQLSTTVVQPTLIERSYTHFGASLQGGASTSTRTRTDVNVNTREGRDATRERNASSSATTRTDSDNPARTAEQPGRTTTGGPTATEPGQQGRTNRRQGEEPEAVGERTRGRDDTTPGSRESKTPTATPNPRDSSGRTPSTPPARSEAEKPASEKSTSEKPGGSSEAAKPEQKGNRSGSASERSSDKPESSSSREGASERRSEKSPGNADQTSKAGSEAPGAAREKKQQE